MSKDENGKAKEGRRLPSLRLVRRMAEVNRYLSQEWKQSLGKRSRPPDEPRHFVYVVSVDAKYFKIGVARDVEQRIAELQVANPCNIEVVRTFAVAHPMRAERYLHKMLEEYHVRGEWFALPIKRLTWLQSLQSLDNVPEPRTDNPNEAAIRHVLTPSLFKLLYHTKSFTLQDIADRFGVSPGFVAGLRRDYGIERPIGRRRKRQGSALKRLGSE